MAINIVTINENQVGSLNSDTPLCVRAVNFTPDIYQVIIVNKSQSQIFANIEFYKTEATSLLGIGMKVVFK